MLSKFTPHLNFLHITMIFFKLGIGQQRDLLILNDRWGLLTFKAVDVQKNLIIWSRSIYFPISSQIISYIRVSSLLRVLIRAIGSIILIVGSRSSWRCYLQWCFHILCHYALNIIIKCIWIILRVSTFYTARILF